MNIRKKSCILVAAILAACALFLTGCGNAATPTPVATATATATASAPTVDTQIAIPENTPFKTAEPTNAATPFVNNALGSRTNPVPLGQSFSTEYLRYKHLDQSIGFTIKITELKRGKVALDYAKSKNQFNKVPEGKELLLFKVEFKLDKFTSEDSFLCSSIHFDYFNSDFGENNTFVSVAGLENLHAKLYPGGSTTGWLYAAVDPSEAKPMAVFDDRVWLALYP